MGLCMLVWHCGFCAEDLRAAWPAVLRDPERSSRLHGDAAGLVVGLYSWGNITVGNEVIFVF